MLEKNHNYNPNPDLLLLFKIFPWLKEQWEIDYEELKILDDEDPNRAMKIASNQHAIGNILNQTKKYPWS